MVEYEISIYSLFVSRSGDYIRITYFHKNENEIFHLSVYFDYTHGNNTFILEVLLSRVYMVFLLLKYGKQGDDPPCVPVIQAEKPSMPEHGNQLWKTVKNQN